MNKCTFCGQEQPCEHETDYILLYTINPIFELLFAVGISADEWSSGQLDESLPADDPQCVHEDQDNLNELGLTVEQRQLILDTLLGNRKWGAIN